MIEKNFRVFPWGADGSATFEIDGDDVVIRITLKEARDSIYVTLDELKSIVAVGEKADEARKILAGVK